MESKSLEVIKMNQELFEGSKISVNVEDIQVGMSSKDFLLIEFIVNTHPS